MGSTALIFGQIQSFIYRWRLWVLFLHLVRGSRRRKSGLDAQTALEWVINIGQAERWQGVLPQGRALVSAEFTGNSPTEQEIIWKSKATRKHSSMPSGVGHHWIKMNLPASTATLEPAMSWQLHPHSHGAWLLMLLMETQENEVYWNSPFPLSRSPPLPLLTAVVSNRKAALSSLKNDLRIQRATLNVTECFWQGSVPSIKTERD